MIAKLPRKSARPAREQLTLDVLRQFRLVYGAVHRHFREVERRCGLSGAQAWVLREIALRPGVGVSELASRLSIHQSTASQLVNKLVQGRFVARDTQAHDRRRVGLRITRAGQRLARRLPRPAQGVLPHALASMPGTAVRSLHTQLTGLIAHLQVRTVRDASEHLGEM